MNPVAARPHPLLEALPGSDEQDAILESFLEYVQGLSLDLYPAQEEAILEVVAGNNVILNTPTGSGKSLVAQAVHFEAMARGQRSAYTAPIKALVSEKFFALCADLGADNVGMVTGDASVNPEAPVICCTAEIVANLALRHGRELPIENIVMDEFHYYADRDRGWAWQVPLLEATGARFVLMSATLGDTSFFAEDLTRRTGRPTAIVASAERPVPLEFGYRETPLVETLEELFDTKRAPVYIVHFTQRAAAEQAQALTSVDVCTREEKERIRELVGGFRFDSPVGKDLRRFVMHGIGLHHAGLLPKYRLLVEKLAQQGALKVVCGTDTLGVGVNVPIRTVLFTQLCKYDGRRTRVLSVRDFQQIAGRAGRKGFDDLGTVWVQAPLHVIENIKAEQKAAADPKKRRKVVKKKPPERGYAHWDEQTLVKLSTGTPETLESSFSVSHSMLLNVLDRPGDGCAALKRLLLDNHEPRSRQRRHIRQAISMYRSLVGAGVLQVMDEPDELGRVVRIDPDLQADFRLNQPLAPFALAMLDLLDTDSETYALDVVTVVESVLENPGVVLAAQLERERTNLINELKAAGVEYEERMARLDELEHPKPLRDFLYDNFNVFAERHPWVGRDNVQPKSVVRDMYERAMTFREYVGFYGLKRSEGVLLRYLSDAYKAMVQTVPESAKTPEVDDLIDWLGAVVRQVDSSLLDEWERLQHPEEAEAEEIRPGAPARPVVDERRLRVALRNELFRWVGLLARRDHDGLAELTAETDWWSARQIEDAIDGYWQEHDEIVVTPEARGPQYFTVDRESTEGVWRIHQTLLDPEGWGEWEIVAEVDLEEAAASDHPPVRLLAVHRAGEPIADRTL